MVGFLVLLTGPLVVDSGEPARAMGFSDVVGGFRIFRVVGDGLSSEGGGVELVVCGNFVVGATGGSAVVVVVVVVGRGGSAVVMAMVVVCRGGVRVVVVVVVVAVVAGRGGVRVVVVVAVVAGRGVLVVGDNVTATVFVVGVVDCAILAVLLGGGGVLTIGEGGVVELVFGDMAMETFGLNVVIVVVVVALGCS